MHLQCPRLQYRSQSQMLSVPIAPTLFSIPLTPSNIHRFEFQPCNASFRPTSHTELIHLFSYRQRSSNSFWTIKLKGKGYRNLRNRNEYGFKNKGPCRRWSGSESDPIDRITSSYYVSHRACIAYLCWKNTRVDFIGMWCVILRKPMSYHQEQRGDNETEQWHCRAVCRQLKSSLCVNLPAAVDFSYDEGCLASLWSDCS